MSVPAICNWSEFLAIRNSLAVKGIHFLAAYFTEVNTTGGAPPESEWLAVGIAKTSAGADPHASGGSARKALVLVSSQISPSEWRSAASARGRTRPRRDRSNPQPSAPVAAQDSVLSDSRRWSS